MFTLARMSDHLIFKREPEVVGISVFLIDDFWRGVEVLATSLKALKMNHKRLSEITARNALRPNEAQTGRAAWKFCADPRISTVYAGDFLDSGQNWVRHVLRTSRLAADSIFFVDHYDKDRNMNGAVETAQLLLSYGVDPKHIFSIRVISAGARPAAGPRF